MVILKIMTNMVSNKQLIRYFLLILITFKRVIVFDIYSKYIPQPVDIKSQSVYDYYDILEEIGTGAFGVVHRCRERKTGNIFAAKFIPVAHNVEKELIKKEIDIMNQLHHPKLINLHDAFEDDDEMVLIFELYCSNRKTL